MSDRLQRPERRDEIKVVLTRLVWFQIQTWVHGKTSSGRQIVRVTASNGETGEGLKAEFINPGGPRILDKQIGDFLILPEDYLRRMVEDDLDVFTNTGIRGRLFSYWINKRETQVYNFGGHGRAAMYGGPFE